MKSISLLAKMTSGFIKGKNLISQREKLSFAVCLDISWECCKINFMVGIYFADSY